MTVCPVWVVREFHAGGQSPIRRERLRLQILTAGCFHENSWRLPSRIPLLWCRAAMCQRCQAAPIFLLKPALGTTRLISQSPLNLLPRWSVPFFQLLLYSHFPLLFLLFHSHSIPGNQLRPEHTTFDSVHGRISQSKGKIKSVVNIEPNL